MRGYSKLKVKKGNNESQSLSQSQTQSQSLSQSQSKKEGINTNNLYIKQNLTQPLTIHHHRELTVESSLLKRISSILEEILNETMTKIESIKRKPSHFLTYSDRIYMEIYENQRNLPFYHESDSINLNLYQYISKIINYSRPELSTIILMLYYIDLSFKSHRILFIKSNIKRIILASFVVSCKYNDDFSMKNSFYAKIGDVSNRRMNKIENLLLELCDFSLFPNDIKYKSYIDYIDNIVRID